MGKMMKILFLGNSHTYFNDMPQVFKEICQAYGIDVDVTMLAFPGVTYGWHLKEKYHLRFALMYGEYQYIITLLLDLSVGVTMVMIETGCTQRDQKGVLCVIPPRKLFAAKELIQSIDADAFITITQIKEVRGQGFTLERRDYSFDK